MRSIALLCPTRGRPARALEMLTSALHTAEHPGRVSVWLLVDACDPALEVYRKLYLPPHAHLVVAERRNVNAATDWLAREVAQGEILVSAPDDVVFRTRGWDRRFEETFKEQGDLVVLYANDGNDRRKLQHAILTRRWVELVGHFQWPAFEHFCGDEWVERIAQGADSLVYLGDVVMEHMHTKYNKAPNDETYRSKRRPAADGSSMSERDNRLMQTLLPDIAARAARVRAARMAAPGC